METKRLRKKREDAYHKYKRLLCLKCYETKLPEEFYNRSGALSGKRSRCISCMGLSTLAYSHTQNGLIRRIYGSQRGSSKKRGHPLQNYTFEEFKTWVLNQSSFDRLYANWVSSNYDRWSTPSADRLNDCKPYTLDNLQLITWRMNMEKYCNGVVNGVNNKLLKPVIQMNLDGGFITEHYSISSAARITNGHTCSISSCCRGERYKTSGGYRWMYSLGIPIANNEA